MRQCSRHREDLLLFHYGELAPAARERLAAHLETCASCRDHLAQLSGFLDRLPRQEVEIPPARINRFASRVAGRAAARRSWRPLLPVWGGAIAAAAMLIAVLLPAGPQPVPPPVPAPARMAELDILQSFELLHDFELLQELELLEELEWRG